MKDSVQMGMNRTGIQMAPILSKEMIADSEELTAPPTTTETYPADFRIMKNQDAGPLGTVPLPGTMTGAAVTGFQKMTGGNPEVFIDKLGERLAFERTGVRLYDHLITKCRALAPEMSLDVLQEIRAEEARHFELLKRTMESIGADPTAMTPCADATGVASMGLLQVLTDSRTTLPQAAEAVLIAELTDNAGWEMLIELALAAGMGETAREFEVAKAREESHLEHIKTWLTQMTLENKAVQIQ